MCKRKTPQTAILVFLLSFSILHSSGLAKYSGGSGEPNDPYQIGTAADLLALAADMNDYGKNFALTADIDLDPNLPGGQVFPAAVIAPDGNSSNAQFDGTAFTGVFEGAGRKILNLTTDTNGLGNDYLGLFGCIGANSEVKNLGLENISVTGGYNSEYLGGLAGQNVGNINNSFVTGAVSGGDDSGCLGGLMGQNDGNISNCFSMGTVTAGNESWCLGGLAGENDGAIGNCFSADTVTSGDSSSFFGGLVGQNNGDISNCFATGAVAAENESWYLGGLVGWNYYGATISDCFSTGDVSSPGYGLGGLVGQNDDGGISSSYFPDSEPNNGYGEPLTDAQMRQQSSFVGWDFVWEAANGTEDIWAICEGVSYPKLAWQSVVGDSDNDKDVDFADFALMALKWLQTDSNLYCGGTDLTGDGWVDLNDLDAFADNWLAGL